MMCIAVPAHRSERTGATRAPGCFCAYLGQYLDTASPIHCRGQLSDKLVGDATSAWPIVICFGAADCLPCCWFCANCAFTAMHSRGDSALACKAWSGVCFPNVDRRLQQT